jgi:hypothetical protein
LGHLNEVIESHARALEGTIVTKPQIRISQLWSNITFRARIIVLKVHIGELANEIS